MVSRYFEGILLKRCVRMDPYCSSFNKFVSYFLGKMSTFKCIRQLENSANRDLRRPSTVHRPIDGP